MKTFASITKNLNKMVTDLRALAKTERANKTAFEQQAKAASQSAANANAEAERADNVADKIADILGN